MNATIADAISLWLRDMVSRYRQRLVLDGTSNAMSQNPSKLWRMFRRLLRIIVGVALAGALYTAITIYATYLRECRIRQEIESVGGKVFLVKNSPQWIPAPVRDKLFFLERINGIKFKPVETVPSVRLFRQLKELPRFDYLISLGVKITDDHLLSLQDISQMRILQLETANVTNAGLAAVASFVNLNQLLLNNSEIADDGLKHLSRLNNLEVLFLSRTRISCAGLAHIKGLPALQHLVLSKTDVGDTECAVFAELKHLWTLDLNDTKISDATISHLTGLQELCMVRLQRTQITDAALESLATMPNLNFVDLTGTATSAAARQKLAGALPNATIKFDVDEKSQ